MPRETKNTLDMTQRELLIRLDERVKVLISQLATLQSNQIPLSEYLSLVARVKDLENKSNVQDMFKTKILAYLTVAGIVGGIIVTLLTDFIRRNLFK